jgi:hypothetical protein
MLAPGRAARGALLILFALSVSACAPFALTQPARSALFGLQSSVKGLIAFSPPSDATDVDPKAIVAVRAARTDAVLKSVTVQNSTGEALPVKREGDFYTVRQGLQPDSKYTVTALATPKLAPGGAPQDDTETSSFATATTPKVTALTPGSIGVTGSVTISLTPAASAISVDGPVRAILGPDGTTVTVVPKNYEQGQKVDFAIIAKNAHGVASLPQAESFTTLPPATVESFPGPGSDNLGVAIPLTLTVSDPPANKDDFAAHIKVTLDVHQPNPIAAMAPDPNSPDPPDLCSHYGSPTVAPGPLDVSTVWLSPTKLQVSPKTADGYWPGNSTITVGANVGGYQTTAGNWVAKDYTSSFTTANKRVIDVNLTTQDLTACSNGTQVNQFPVATGIPMFATSTGNFYIYYRVADEEMKNPDEGPGGPYWYDLKHVPWTQYFDRGRALHGAWWHAHSDPWGHPRSHGCVNVQDPTNNYNDPGAKPQARWLWDFDYLGDPVIVHGVTPGLSAASQPSGY